MQYILAPEKLSELANVTGYFNYNNTTLSVNVNTVPYRRNYRTNIYGDIFTDDAELVVKIVNDFYKDDYKKEY